MGNQTLVYVTNGKLGTDNNWAFWYCLNNAHARSRLRGWVQEMANRSGREAWAETRDGVKLDYPFMVAYPRSK
jgi:hypothetical protein